MASGRPETRASAGPRGGDLHETRPSARPCLRGAHELVSLRRAMASGRHETCASAGPLGGDLHKLARRRPVPSIEGGHSFASLRRIVPATRRMKLAGRRGRLGGTSRNSSVGAAPSRPDRWSHLSSGCHGPRPKTAFVGEGGLARTNWFACEPLFFVRTIKSRFLCEKVKGASSCAEVQAAFRAAFVANRLMSR